jgi:SRSO17 transposase
MLGWRMIKAIQQAGTLRCRWVACDAGFGRDTALLDNIDSLGLWYFAAVPHDTHVWQARPATAVPAWSGRGRTPTRAQVLDPTVMPDTVVAIAGQLLPHAWSRHVIKYGSQGPLVAEFAFVRVIAVRDGLPGPEVWLVLRRSLTDGELKTYRCNAPAATAHLRLVRTSGMRWPIETCFEISTQELGMGDYELRSWCGWHHHMTLVILALSFLVRLQCRLKKTLRP